MSSTSKFTFRATTAVCLVVAVVCVIVGIAYFTKTAGALPRFFPGHTAGSTHHHTKHAIAFIGLAIVALFGAWLSTAPKRN